MAPKQNRAPDPLSETVAIAYILPKTAEERKSKANFIMLVCANSFLAKSAKSFKRKMDSDQHSPECKQRWRENTALLRKGAGLLPAV